MLKEKKARKVTTENAIVTLYKFDGYDFNSSRLTRIPLDIAVEELENSSWDVYLKYAVPGDTAYFNIPGLGAFGTSEYSSGHQVISNQPAIFVILRTGPGEEYSEIHVIRTEVSEVVDNTTGRSSAPVDMWDYEAVVAYYGLD